MSKLIINGGLPLFGEVKISGSKNAALPLICASLMTEERVILNNIPNLADINNLLDVLVNAGVEVERYGNTVSMQASHDINRNFGDEILSEMRASILLLGAIIARFNEVKVRIPGGCKIGSRPHEQHIKGFNALGIHTQESDMGIECTTIGKIGANITFDVVTVTGTENVIMAAVLAKGETVLKNVAKEPEVVDLINMLNQMGAKISWISGDELLIQGVKKLNGITYSIIPDRIEAGTFMSAVAGTSGDIIIDNINARHVSLISEMLVNMGCELNIYNDEKTIRVKSDKKLKSINIETQPFPGFPTDLQPLFVVLNSVSSGESFVKETIYENRLSHANDLITMGGDLKVEDRIVYINGVSRLIGNTVFPRDLRASAAMVVAGLIADGETVVRNLQYLDRGYDSIDVKLKSLGAKIRRE
jgi:UDP-N-acetylglucosamine 1-carboxyvinyltransferase